MLAELHIENFAIIDEVHLTFEKGLTVLTGETGAGKSIILDAIHLLLGARGSVEYVRHEANKTDIEALFHIGDDHPSHQGLDELGIEIEEGILIIRRTISKNGKSTCRINGKLVTLAHVRTVGQYLVDIHGQHEHQELMQSDKHILMLDRFGGEPLKEAKTSYKVHYDEAKAIQTRIQTLQENEQHVAQRLDLLAYQINEIGEAELTVGEEEDLLEERTKLANFERLYQGLNQSYDAINSDNKGLDWLRQAMNELEDVQELDKGLKSVYEQVANSFYILEEQAFYLRDQLDTMEYQPEKLEMIETRLNDIQMLKRKYGSTISDILEHFDNIQKEYDELKHRDVTLDGLQHDYQVAMDKLREKADRLHNLRLETADSLAQNINQELNDLYMEKAVFDISVRQSDQIERIEGYGANGADHVQFLIASNPGEPLKPLAKIASGGELSRIMLAIKSRFKSFQNVTSIIFDEVDTGVSGRVAQAMAEKIYGLSASSQIFCITHLPQVAAMADHHLYISKQTDNERTATKVDTLTAGETAQEIGRMISGAEMTNLTMQHAEELLDLAEEMKSGS
ncbi:DNA repair protein RecN [Tuberibacillus sp. Marseille-P3662]|uniref:DNA repair protein RecN n=1 Tax=Tuberibacillus sp. Marseille-P3662 TaxID=1965358 RepID=UPI000A1CBF3C|nr:DNA repair protein RecN [Tuberibacillus sp. Marseille-P3662]